MITARFMQSAEELHMLLLNSYLPATTAILSTVLSPTAAVSSATVRTVTSVGGDRNGGAEGGGGKGDAEGRGDGEGGGRGGLLGGGEGGGGEADGGGGDGEADGGGGGGVNEHVSDVHEVWQQPPRYMPRLAIVGFDEPRAAPVVPWMCLYELVPPTLKEALAKVPLLEYDAAFSPYSASTQKFWES